MTLWSKIKSALTSTDSVGTANTVPYKGRVTSSPTGRVTSGPIETDRQWEIDIAIASNDMYGAIQYLSLDKVLEMAKIQQQ